MTVSLRLNESDAAFIKAYTAMHGLTLSDFARTAMLERIEDEFDIQTASLALAEHRKNPVTHDWENVKKDLGL